ncbi:MAG: hypothetical protein JW910_11400, partial [Anaerolineae bacterium]|nr:hypothetical protein [Anaerolineae bacterium]
YIPRYAPGPPCGEDRTLSESSEKRHFWQGSKNGRAVAPALQTDFEAAARARRFWEELGFGVIRVPDSAGLVRPRMVCSLINEAVRTLAESGATVEDVDTAMQLGMNAPRGPLSWADEIGLDVVVGTLEALLRTWGEDRYLPAPLLRQKVFAGHLGKKTGRGFYAYQRPAGA